MRIEHSIANEKAAQMDKGFFFVNHVYNNCNKSLLTINGYNQ